MIKQVYMFLPSGVPMCANRYSHISCVFWSEIYKFHSSDIRYASSGDNMQLKLDTKVKSLY